MTYRLGSVSRANLRGVHPDLCRVVHTAIGLTTQDFRVVEGVRTVQRQEQLVAQGASRTLNSRHISGHAVDLAALSPSGQISWEWERYYQIALAMQKASDIEHVPLRWGGVWDRWLSELTTNIKAEVASYTARYKKLNPGRSPLLDGPHFELPQSVHPDTSPVIP